MRYALVAVTLIVGILLGGKYILGDIFVDGLPAALILSGSTSYELKDAIFKHYKHQVGLDKNYMFRDGEYKITSEYIDMDNDNQKDLIVVFESDYTCGTGGCLAGIFKRTEANHFEPIEKFSYAVKEIEALDTFTNGMRDIRINNDSTSIMTWNGTSYALESI